MKNILPLLVLFGIFVSLLHNKLSTKNNLKYKKIITNLEFLSFTLMGLIGIFIIVCSFFL